MTDTAPQPHWHPASIVMGLKTGQIETDIGPDRNLTYQQARAETQALLDKLAADNPYAAERAAAIWRTARSGDHDSDDWVYFQYRNRQFVFTVFPCADDCREGAIAFLTDMVETNNQSLAQVGSGLRLEVPVFPEDWPHGYIRGFGDHVPKEWLAR